MTAAALSLPARRRVLAVAAIAMALFGAVIALDPTTTARRFREAAADGLLLATAVPPSGDVLVVDIDRDSLVALGPWPWPRSTTADLVAAIGAAKPAAIALDILFSSPGDRVMDRHLAEALNAAPTVLSVLFSDRPDAGQSLRPAPLVTAGPDPGLTPWREAGSSGPAPLFAVAAASSGLGALAADGDGLIRRVPLIGVADRTNLPGLAAEAVRLAKGASALILDGRTAMLRIADRALPLVETADLRIRPTRREDWALRRVSAAAVLAGAVPAERIAGKVVIVGGSAPALGALRASAASPITPSIEIQADAVETMLSGTVPVRPPDAAYVEATSAAMVGAVAALVAAAFGPLTAALATLVLAAAAAATAAGALLGFGYVFDAVTPAAAVIVAGAGGILGAGWEARKAAAAIRRRFEQHLAPAVVRIVAEPDLVKLSGERRIVTALFTDIEGFTALTDRLEPEDLVSLLDRYFGKVTGIVTAHGGMVDKIVGDAVHALFNAPLDLADHADRAIAAALEIRAVTEAFRREEGIDGLGLGRTRIGIESGPVVVGDVGSGTKLDYTAHGAAVNTAARLEALNKSLGTAICVGPGAHALCPGRAFRPLGLVEVRGRGELAVYEPLGAAAPRPAAVSRIRWRRRPRSAPRPSARPA